MEDTIKAFKALDADNDGCLTKYELTKAYESIYGHNASSLAKSIFDKLDMDESGHIDYAEWVVATVDKKALMTP